jgi:hypothetical protein
MAQAGLHSLVSLPLKVVANRKGTDARLSSAVCCLMLTTWLWR